MDSTDQSMLSTGHRHRVTDALNETHAHFPPRKLTKALKVCSCAKSFFFKSTLDLCIVDSNTFKPKFFIELDSSWHDKPKQIENDRMKNEIFEKAGMELHRLRKKENKSMDEIFELYIKKNYVC